MLKLMWKRRSSGAGNERLICNKRKLEGRRMKAGEKDLRTSAPDRISEKMG